ncbi:MAG: PQQ-dependent sugar dehydrogenase [Vicinamibacterales bacterium]
MPGRLQCCLSLVFLLGALAIASACTRSPAPTPPPGSGNGESITGRERLGWNQPAGDLSDLGGLRYAIYVDGTRTEIADVSCGTTAGTGGYPCSGRLPAMSTGTHTLELAAYIDDGTTIEGTRSSPLRVTVTGATGASASTIAEGDVFTSSDGIRLRVEVLYDRLDDPAALALEPGGRVFVGSRTGALTVIDADRGARSVATDAGAILSIALSPTYDRDGLVYLTHAVSSGDGQSFRTARYRLTGDRLGERMVLLENGPASREPAAALRVGRDGKLYAAFDNGGSSDAGHRMSEWSGKILRMELDGRTPEDQAAASPVLWHGLTSPRGFDWALDASALWIADRSDDGIERLRVVETGAARPRRARQRETFILPRGFGASAVSFHRGGPVPELAGDLFVAGLDAGYILRIRVDPADPGRPHATERLLAGRVGTVRALEVGPDGAIYFCTDTALMRLVRQP